MRLTALLLLSFVCSASTFGGQRLSIGKPSALDLLREQANAFRTAVKNKDKDTILKLFVSEKVDRPFLNKLFTIYRDIEITSVSAEFTGADDVEGIIKFIVNRRTSPEIKLHMIKASDSPTGWKIDEIQSPSRPSKRNFSMCWVGLFWCCIELLVRTADGDW